MKKQIVVLTLFIIFQLQAAEVAEVANPSNLSVRNMSVETWKSLTALEAEEYYLAFDEQEKRQLLLKLIDAYKPELCSALEINAPMIIWFEDMRGFLIKIPFGGLWFHDVTVNFFNKDDEVNQAFMKVFKSCIDNESKRVLNTMPEKLPYFCALLRENGLTTIMAIDNFQDQKILIFLKKLLAKEGKAEMLPKICIGDTFCAKQVSSWLREILLTLIEESELRDLSNRSSFSVLARN